MLTNGVHHDDLPYTPPADPAKHTLTLQSRFLGALSAATEFLDALKVPPSDYMVMAGGGIFLHQLARGALLDRAPTDLDIVLKNTSQLPAVMKAVEDFGPLYFNSVCVHTHEREHHGYRFPNPVIEAETRDGFPVDFIPGSMITKFPDCHDLFPGQAYHFPTESDRLYELSPTVDIAGVGEVKIAHPGFIAFYKMTMLRNTNGKQDNEDLVRLKTIGALDPADQALREVMSVIAHNDTGLMQRLMKKIEAIGS